MTLAALMAALVVLLAACGGGGSSPSAAETDAVVPSAAASEPASEAPAESEAASEEPAASEERVRIDGSQFDPAELTVAVGTEVVWVNADTFAHTVTEGTGGQAADDPIVDEEIAQNGSVSVVFDEAGTYEITCAIHPSMQMTITVEG
ncbi:MAG: cupredoxin domain-containing protein [Candidatus Limnocylindria bacterium]